jgi:tRNA 2-thiouridine synthesizing protein C|tara:strand:- start:637 stop:1011 length:375 start_codon:yes stop_codon:yes gene_type:complete
VSEINSSKTVSIISRQAPYGSNRAQQSLDIALAAAVFEQTVNYIFMGDGVYQLLGNQNATSIQSKTLVNALETLDLYGIESIFVDSQSLRERNLIPKDLSLKASIVSRDEIAIIVRASNSVFNL